MEYRRLGNSGLQLSGFAYGSWVNFGRGVDLNAAIECLSIAYAAGVNFFDNAEGYAWGQSELLMGEALRRLNWSRDSYCLSSKVMFGSKKDPSPLQRGLSRKHVAEACDQALQRLNVSYLDLYYCHRPDFDTPVEETVRAMDNLVRQGKVLYWGTSEWPAERIAQAYEIAIEHHLTPPTMEQPQYNLFHQRTVEVEYEPLIGKYGMGTTVWSPLCSGILTGKYNSGIPAGTRATLSGFDWLAKDLTSASGVARIEATKRLGAIADDLGISLTHLALAWTRVNPKVSTTILGASNPEQLRDNLRATDVVALLTPDVQKAINGVLAEFTAVEIRT